MQVSEIWRYPVKSMQGEPLTVAEVDELGIRGDRGWALVDRETNLALTARRMPELLYGAARSVDGEVVVTLPDGTETADDAVLSAWVGRDVELRPADPDQVGTYESQADETETGQWFQWSGPAGSFHDSTRTKVSLVTRDAFRSWNSRRFRINVILDGTGDVGLVGHKVDVGSATIDVLKQIDRCVMTTRPQPPLGHQPELERDLSVLRTISAENDTFLGVGGLVVSGGTISVGDTLTVV